MALPTVTQQNLFDKRSEDNAWDIVLLHHSECTACGDIEGQLEGIAGNYPTVTFSKLDVTSDDIPLFAPPVLPSILALHNGTRIWEALGTFSNTTNLETTITNWLNMQVNFDMISGATSIHEFST